MAEDEASKPAGVSLVDPLIADLVIHVDGAKFLGEFEGQENSFACRSNAAANRVIGVVEKKLGKN